MCDIHPKLLDEMPVLNESICNGCGDVYDDSVNFCKRMIVENGQEYAWCCSDCMRRLQLCQGCGCDIWCDKCEDEEADWEDHECNDRMCADCAGDE